MGKSIEEPISVKNQLTSIPNTPKNLINLMNVSAEIKTSKKKLRKKVKKNVIFFLLIFL